MSTDDLTGQSKTSFWLAYKSKFKVACIVTVITTIFALAGGNFIMGLFSPISGNSDFQFSDLYCKVAHKMVDNPNSSAITIIATDSLTTRDQIADAIRYINRFDPKILGVDIHFAQPQDSETDAKLIAALNEFDGSVVLPNPLYETEFGELREYGKTFLSQHLNNVEYGSTNYTLNSNWGPTRKFETSFVDGNTR